MSAGSKGHHVGTMADGVRVRVFRDELAGPEFELERKLLRDIDRPVEPAQGWRYCADVTCGVEVQHEHPRRVCRAHRGYGRPRPAHPLPLTVTHPWSVFTVHGRPAKGGE